MGRHHSRRRRISRPLIATLGVTIAVGGGVYLHNIHKSHADRERISLKAVEPSAQIPKPSANESSAGHSLTPVPPGALLTQTPGLAIEPGATVTLALAIAHPTTAPSARPAEPKTASGHPPAMPAPPHPIAPAAPTIPAVLASSTIAGAQPLAEAKAKISAEDFLGARTLLNTALASGHLTAGDAVSARHMLGEISQVVLFSKKRIKDDPFQTLYQVQGGERLARIAEKHGITWELLCRINGLSDPRKVRAGQWIKIPSGPFHCVITKSDYRLDVYLGAPGEPGSLFVTTFPVGLGKDNSTPTGLWIIAPSSKAHPATYYSPRGEGVIAADDPKNPLGGFWLGLNGISGAAVEKSSYGIHGTIEPDTIGKQASMGCIRLRHDDIAFLYDLLVDGKSKVVVKD